MTLSTTAIDSLAAKSRELQLENRAWPESPQVLLQRMIGKLDRVLLGKEQVVRQAVIAMLAGGHVLLEDVPGVGKTMLAGSLARTIAGEFSRIQFTADLLPADVAGSMVLDRKSGDLAYRPGPLMANVVLADELNRAAPRTQSALLEAMEERTITVDGRTRRLPVPFMLIATQNPLSFSGVSRLPEAQLDRFMMRLSIGYPAQDAEAQMLAQFAAGSRMLPARVKPVIAVEEWLQMQAEARQVQVQSTLLEFMTSIGAASRLQEEVALGLSPRALRDWLRAGQASAYLEGRSYLLPDDLLDTAEAVLAHRLVLLYADAAKSQECVRRLLAMVGVPGIGGNVKGGKRL